MTYVYWYLKVQTPVGFMISLRTGVVNGALAAPETFSISKWAGEFMYARDQKKYIYTHQIQNVSKIKSNEMLYIIVFIKYTNIILNRYDLVLIILFKKWKDNQLDIIQNHEHCEVLVCNQ